MRRASRARVDAAGKKVGHTGTLDPLASGVLPLVLGKATRLAQFLSSADKEYEADIELGVSTTTLDRGGEIVARERTRARSADLTASIDRGSGRRVPRHVSAAAARLFRQENRRRSRVRSRAPQRAGPAAAGAGDGDRRSRCSNGAAALLRLRLVCSAGYYVRSLASASASAWAPARISPAWSGRAAAIFRSLSRRPRRPRSQPARGGRAGDSARSAAAVLAGAHADRRRERPWRPVAGLSGRHMVDAPAALSEGGPSPAAAPRRPPGGHRRAAAGGAPGRHFCIPASYWNKITRLGLTHCGGLGSVAGERRPRRSAGPLAEVTYSWH